MSVFIGANVEVGDYRNKIAASWKKATDGIIDTGLYLLEAEESLGRLGFRDLRRELEDNNIMSSSVVSKIMGIARNPVLTNPEYRSNLPPSYATLYLLSQQDHIALEGKIVDREITPDTEQREVKELFGVTTKTVSEDKSRSNDKIIFRGNFECVVDKDWEALLRVLKRLQKTGVKIEGVMV